MPLFDQSGLFHQTSVVHSTTEPSLLFYTLTANDLPRSNYTVSGGDRGRFEMFAIPALYRRGISLSQISGSYNARNLVTGYTGNATISQSGKISGSDSFGCVYGGQILILDPNFNLFEVTVTVSQCGVSDGTYKGYGAQIDYYKLEDRRALRLIGTNGQYAGVFDLYR